MRYETMPELLRSPSQVLGSAGIALLRSYEDAATAIGRLDAAAKLADSGFRELLVLRCIATPTAATLKGMIALVRPDGEGDDALLRYGAAVRSGAARARGGVPPTLASLHDLLGLPAPSATNRELDEFFRDAHERTPPVLKAALAAHAIQESSPDKPAERDERLAALAVTLVLCVGGAITDAWLTLPMPASRAPTFGADAAESLGFTFAALARESRAAERGLAAAREIADADEQRVRAALGRASISALEVLALLRSELVITVPDTARTLGLTPPTAGAAVARLVELGIAVEVTGKARSRAFAYEGVVRALGAD